MIYPTKYLLLVMKAQQVLRIHERLSDRKDIELLATADEDRKMWEAIKEVAKGELYFSLP